MPKGGGAPGASEASKGCSCHLVSNQAPPAYGAFGALVLALAVRRRRSPG
ncbi:MAG: MYXO-CTERM sorting domain-containing protein [Solimonas sp.]